MRSFHHLTPRYIVDRIAVSQYERRHPDHPWLAADAITFLSTWLLPSDVGLELGSGRSTVWFARRIKHLTSIEHNPDWHGRIARLLKQHSLANVHYHLRIADQKRSEEAITALGKLIDGLPDAALDFALIDGIVRDHCTLHALPKLKPSGLLIVDNANWYLPCNSRSPNSRGPAHGPASEVWREVWKTIGSWRHYWTSNGVTDTAIFIRPTE